MKNLSLHIDEHGTADLIFDRPGSTANIFDLETLNELSEALDEIESHDGVERLVISSAKDGIFIAGADLKSIANASPETLEAFLHQGQDLFNRIADLPLPTAAAIHGACLGGGLEIALACDIRVASPDRSTRIGLPETQLGIIPAWGGSTRLPRLIGVPEALSLILGGKQLSSRHARKKGVIDAVAPRERLRLRCLQILDRPRPRKPLRWKNSAPARFAAARLSKRRLLDKTRGHYPALLRAVELVSSAPGRSRQDSLKAERDAVIALASTRGTRQLIRLFFLSEQARKKNVLKPGQAEVPPIENGAVIGAGVMGAGIAHWMATRDFPVLLRDIDESAVARGMQTIHRRFEEAVGRRILTANEARTKEGLVFPSADPVPMKHLDLVIEAATEDFGIKKEIFADLERRVAPETIFATNTSALPITEMSMSLAHPQRIIGLHFFNPVHRMKLVEVVHTELTDPVVIQSALDFVKKLGKFPVLVKDSPGFLVNRILMPYLIEAGHLLESGVAPRTIDEAMLDFGMPVGPIRLLDDIGLDVALHVAHTMAAAFPDRMQVPGLLERLVEEKILGRKVQRGIYTYPSRRPQPNPEALGMIPKNRSLPREEIAERLSLLMVAESYRCLEEEIVSSSDELDFAMILGTGWAPFRGGPITYAEEIGIENVRKRLRHYATLSGIAYSLPATLAGPSTQLESLTTV